jgi:hypothetical protein
MRNAYPVPVHAEISKHERPMTTYREGISLVVTFGDNASHWISPPAFAGVEMTHQEVSWSFLNTEP